MLGESVGAYRVLKKLGEGGMGEVYLAEHTRLYRRAAIKVLLPDLSSNAEAVDRLFAEARATSLIRHPAIVEVLDCDVHPSGRAYIVMEYLEGETLAELLGRDPGLRGDPVIAAAVIGVAAGGLGAAHERGVVHRDVKPENLFIVHEGTPTGAPAVKVLDFGVAKLTPHALRSASKTKSGFFIGTPTYMSPEQCRAAGKVDARTDVYALGCILYELCAGTPPFVSESPGELIALHLLERPRALGSVAAGVPPALAALVERMLAKDPDERPQSMVEVIAALEEVAGVPSARFPELVASSPVIERARQGWRQSRALAASMEASLGEAVGRPTAALLANGARAGRETVDVVGATVTPPPALATERRPRRGPLPAVLAGGVLILVGGTFAARGLLRPAATEGPAEPAPRSAAVPRAPRPIATPLPSADDGATPAPRAVALTSVPPGAEVWVAGEERPRGTTPLSLTFPPGAERAELRLRRDGYAERRATVAADAEAVTLTLERVRRPPGSRPSKPAPRDEADFIMVGD